MKRFRNLSPEEVMRKVTTEMVLRAVKLGRRKGRQIYISKSSGGQGVPVDHLDPRTPEGRRALEQFLTPVKRHYTFHGLGLPEEKNAINWRKLNVSTPRRILLFIQLILSLIMKGTPLKNKFLRIMGVHIGKNTEIMQGVWLDHFRPELIFIGDNTLIGAFSRLTVHAYEGGGRFRYGLIEIGNRCIIGAGTGMGAIKIEDDVRVLPGTVLSPYLTRIRSRSVVGWNPPNVRRLEEQENAGDSD